MDVLVSPATPTTAFPNIGERADDPMAMYLADLATIPSNLAGNAAMSLPCGPGARGTACRSACRSSPPTDGRRPALQGWVPPSRPGTSPGGAVRCWTRPRRCNARNSHGNFRGDTRWPRRRPPRARLARSSASACRCSARSAS
ncbi:amidase family protein [Yinghuangia aomiensis]